MVGDERVEVFGPRVEQLVADLETLEWRGGDQLAERLSAHVADGEPGEDELALDEHEQRALLAVLDRYEGTAVEPLPDDLRSLQDALRRTLGPSQPGVS
jgi:hypothetical protein